MSFRNTVLLGTAGWVLAITLLQVYLNEGGIGLRSNPDNFRVGFLPVT
jgi:hypothetical protein